MSEAGPLGAGAALARPAAWMYGLAVAARNAAFDRGVGVRRAAVAVISIGNLTVGGTGKTPLTAWAANALRTAGHRPAIAMRGYRAPPGEESDEALEYAAILPGIPVLAAPDRAGSIARALRERPGAIDCVVLDDGFQHRRLARDADIVLVDASRPALDGALLPAGWLRESPAALRRASAIVVTRAERPDPVLARRIAELGGQAPIAWTQHGWQALEVHERGMSHREQTHWLHGRRAVGLFGVGNAAALRDAYTHAGAALVAEVPARDHAHHDARTVRAIIDAARRAGAEILATTRKDWMKLERPWRASAAVENVAVVVPDLRIRFLSGEESLRRHVLAAVDSARNRAASPS